MSNNQNSLLHESNKVSGIKYFPIISFITVHHTTLFVDYIKRTNTGRDVTPVSQLVLTVSLRKSRYLTTTGHWSSAYFLA